MRWFVVALSSTAVAIKIIEDAGEMKTRPGRLALGVLIAQDLAFVPMILVIGMFAVGVFVPSRVHVGLKSVNVPSES